MDASFLFGMIGPPVNGVFPSPEISERDDAGREKRPVARSRRYLGARTLVMWVRAARRARGGRAEGNVYCAPDAWIEGGRDDIQGQRVFRWQRQVNRL
jgi:hypothetical protein